MKKPKNIFLVSFFSLMLLLAFTNCDTVTTPEDNTTSDPGINLLKTGNGGNGGGGIILDELNEEEAAGLIYMVEEEKMAHDVYTYFFDQYGEIIFDNIAASEAKHMAAIQKKLVIYELDDPTANNDVGVFNDESLQELYNTLIASGSTSLTDALATGALIEETDILDLQEEIQLLDGNIDIQNVYTHLMIGSENHLRAFVKYLAVYGIEYQPQLLDQETFDRIMNKTDKKHRYQVRY